MGEHSAARYFRISLLSLLFRHLQASRLGGDFLGTSHSRFGHLPASQGGATTAINIGHPAKIQITLYYCLNRMIDFKSGSYDSPKSDDIS
jgi:hypothetical protein